MPHPDSIIARADVLPPTFVCSQANVGLSAAWVHVAGELDIATTPQLDRTLREAELQTRLVVLDLRDVPFMDSSGVHTIVDASVRARELGRRLVLLRGPPNVDRMFALTVSSDEVEICDVDPGAPPAQALRQLTDAGRASVGNDQTLADAEQTASEVDQRAADADQTAADRDWASSERDRALSEADQRASDRAQAASDREAGDAGTGGGAGEQSREIARRHRAEASPARAQTRLERAESMKVRFAAAERRDKAALARDVAAKGRDRSATARDRLAAQ